MTNQERDEKIVGLMNLIKAARDVKHEKHDSLTNAQEREILATIKAAGQEVVDLIVEGANVCEECKQKPHGMVQYTALKGKPVSYYEVGCFTCLGNRSQGFSTEAAVSSWNKKEYL